MSGLTIGHFFPPDTRIFSWMGVAGVTASDKGEVRSAIHRVFVDMCYPLYAEYTFLFLLFARRVSLCVIIQSRFGVLHFWPH